MNTTQTTQQQEPTIELTINASWYNVIIAGLEELPHKFSRTVIDGIAQQAKPQIEKLQQGITNG